MPKLKHYFNGELHFVFTSLLYQKYSQYIYIFQELCDPKKHKTLPPVLGVRRTIFNTKQSIASCIQRQSSDSIAPLFFRSSGYKRDSVNRVPFIYTNQILFLMWWIMDVKNDPFFFAWMQEKTLSCRFKSRLKTNQGEAVSGTFKVIIL